MTQYTKEELKALNKIAQDIFGCDFEELDYDDQDYIYCTYEEEG